MRRNESRRKQTVRAFALSEIILTITTATTVIGTAMTALTVYLSITDEQAQMLTADNEAIAIMPADEVSMDAMLFHLDFQELIHEAKLVYVIGGSRFQPFSEAAPEFVFSPPLNSNALHRFSVLESLSHAPDRALSSYVITQLLKQTYASAFTSTDPEFAAYRDREFTLFVIDEANQTTAIITQRVIVEGDWVRLEVVSYRPNDESWMETTAYRCAVLKSEFDSKSPYLSIGAEHYWVRHDRVDPVTSASSENSLWNRHEEGFCRVEFPDNTWNLAKHEDEEPLTSKFTYFIPIVR